MNTQTKLVGSLKDCLKALDLKDGMTLSFHHHLRNGDYVLNMVLAACAELGLKNLRINASSIFDIHAPLIEHAKNGVVAALECNYMGSVVGKAVSEGLLAEPVLFRTHGGRPADIKTGASPIDVAFIAAPAADPMGNISGSIGPSACGSLGYAMADAEFAKKVVAITDHLLPYPLMPCSIPETQVDYVVQVEQIGDPKGIVSGTTQVTRDPIGHLMAKYAARAIEASGLLKDGFSFQTGAGGASLATALYLKDRMIEKGIQGSFGMGGITAYLVEMLEMGLFKELIDVQCFDLEAVRSIRENAAHHEVSALQYAAPRPAVKSSFVDSLGVVILGATEVDTNFNVNVHTNSRGYIMGGSGGHSDTAAGAKMAMIIAPLIRARLPLFVDRVNTISTPGSTVDAVVTQYGLAVNPARQDLLEAFKSAGLPTFTAQELKAKAEALCGVPSPLKKGGRVVAKVRYRDGSIIDEIYSVN